MSDEPKRSRLWIGWALLAAIVLYILSVGPVWWLAFHYGKPSKHTFSVSTGRLFLCEKRDP